MTEQQTPASVVERLRAPHGSAYRFIAAALIERLSAEREGLREAAQTAHDTLIELNPSNYDHGDVCQANAASVEAILILADALGQRHGKTDEWWSARRAALTPGESRQTVVCICVARGDGPEGCGVCNETGVKP